MASGSWVRSSGVSKRRPQSGLGVSSSVALSGWASNWCTGVVKGKRRGDGRGLEVPRREDGAAAGAGAGAGVVIMSGGASGGGRRGVEVREVGRRADEGRRPEDWRCMR